MGWYGYGYRPYVPVARRRANAARQMAKLAKKGQTVSPVQIEGRQIARTFWGNAWCENLEAYSDFANRLPRGRTYVRNGSVVDLQIHPGKVAARVAGSELYKVDIKIKPLARNHWQALGARCAGQIASVLELLQGRLSAAVMEIVTDRAGGLFPKPSEISLDCSCPDWADMCKHVAAVLYGVGARLDERPELLFLLRQVDHTELIAQSAAAQSLAPAPAAGTKTIADADLAEVFGVELDGGDGKPPPAAAVAPKTRGRRAVSKREPATAKPPRSARKSTAKPRGKGKPKGSKPANRARRSSSKAAGSRKRAKAMP